MGDCGANAGKPSEWCLKFVGIVRVGRPLLHRELRTIIREKSKAGKPSLHRADAE